MNRTKAIKKSAASQKITKIRKNFNKMLQKYKQFTEINKRQPKEGLSVKENRLVRWRRTANYYMFKLGNHQQTALNQLRTIKQASRRQTWFKMYQQYIEFQQFNGFYPESVVYPGLEKKLYYWYLNTTNGAKFERLNEEQKEKLRNIKENIRAIEIDAFSEYANQLLKFTEINGYLPPYSKNGDNCLHYWYHNAKRNYNSLLSEQQAILNEIKSKVKNLSTKVRVDEITKQNVKCDQYMDLLRKNIIPTRKESVKLSKWYERSKNAPTFKKNQELQNKFAILKETRAQVKKEFGKQQNQIRQKWLEQYQLQNQEISPTSDDILSNLLYSWQERSASVNHEETKEQQ